MNVQDAAGALRRGELVILLDPGAPMPKAYVIAAASIISPEVVAIIVNESRSILCAAVSDSRLKDLALPPMIGAGTTAHPRGVEFSISVEARNNVTTGISAADRAQTLRTLACSGDPRRELVTPGHIFPLRAKNGGVLVRADAPEAAVDLIVAADLPQVAALALLLDERGDVMSLQLAQELAKRLRCPCVSVGDVITHRLSTERIVEPLARAKLPTAYGGMFEAVCFGSKTDGAEHLALVKGPIDLREPDGRQAPVLVRVQSEHRLGDLLGFLSTPGWRRVQGALKAIGEEGRGVFIYIRHPYRGVLTEQLRSAEQARSPSGESPASAGGELREYGIGAQMLRLLGVERIRLMTNSPTTTPALDAFQLEIVDRCSFAPLPAEMSTSDVESIRP